MRRHYLIMGDPDTGKSHLAKLITENKKTAILEGNMLNRPFVFTLCSRDTEFIIVDDEIDKYIDDVIRIALCDTIKVNKPHEDSFEICPKFIIVTRNKIEINQVIKNNFFIYEAK